jgi:hypothetical protein
MAEVAQVVDEDVIQSAPVAMVTFEDDELGHDVPSPQSLPSLPVYFTSSDDDGVQVSSEEEDNGGWADVEPPLAPRGALFWAREVRRFDVFRERNARIWQAGEAATAQLEREPGFERRDMPRWSPQHRERYRRRERILRRQHEQAIHRHIVRSGGLPLLDEMSDDDLLEYEAAMARRTVRESFEGGAAATIADMFGGGGGDSTLSLVRSFAVMLYTATQIPNKGVAAMHVANWCCDNLAIADTIEGFKIDAVGPLTAMMAAFKRSWDGPKGANRTQLWAQEAVKRHDKRQAKHKRDEDQYQQVVADRELAWAIVDELRDGKAWVDIVRECRPSDAVRRHVLVAAPWAEVVLGSVASSDDEDEGSATAQLGYESAGAGHSMPTKESVAETMKNLAPSVHEDRTRVATSFMSVLGNNAVVAFAIKLSEEMLKTQFPGKLWKMLAHVRISFVDVPTFLKGVLDIISLARGVLKAMWTGDPEDILRAAPGPVGVSFEALNLTAQFRRGEKVVRADAEAVLARLRDKLRLMANTLDVKSSGTYRAATKDVIELENALQERFQSAMQVESFGVHIVGAPGCGKSTWLSQILIGLSTGWFGATTAQEHIYKLEIGKKFDDKATSMSQIGVMEDPFNKQPSIMLPGTDPATVIMEFCGPAPWDVNKSAVDEKKMMSINTYLLGITSNVKEPNFSAWSLAPDSVERRLPLVVLYSAPKFPNGKWDYDHPTGTLLEYVPGVRPDDVGTRKRLGTYTGPALAKAVTEWVQMRRAQNVASFEHIHAVERCETCHLPPTMCYCGLKAASVSAATVGLAYMLLGSIALGVVPIFVFQWARFAQRVRDNRWYAKAAGHLEVAYERYKIAVHYTQHVAWPAVEKIGNKLVSLGDVSAQLRQRALVLLEKYDNTLNWVALAAACAALVSICVYTKYRNAVVMPYCEEGSWNHYRGASGVSAGPALRSAQLYSFALRVQGMAKVVQVRNGDDTNSAVGMPTVRGLQAATVRHIFPDMTLEGARYSVAPLGTPLGHVGHWSPINALYARVTGPDRVTLDDTRFGAFSLAADDFHAGGAIEPLPGYLMVEGGTRVVETVFRWVPHGFRYSVAVGGDPSQGVVQQSAHWSCDATAVSGDCGAYGFAEVDGRPLVLGFICAVSVEGRRAETKLALCAPAADGQSYVMLPKGSRSIEDYRAACAEVGQSLVQGVHERSGVPYVRQFVRHLGKLVPGVSANVQRCMVPTPYASRVVSAWGPDEWRGPHHKDRVIYDGVRYSWSGKRLRELRDATGFVDNLPCVRELVRLCVAKAIAAPQRAGMDVPARRFTMDEAVWGVGGIPPINMATAAGLTPGAGKKREHADLKDVGGVQRWVLREEMIKRVGNVLETWERGEIYPMLPKMSMKANQAVKGPDGANATKMQRVVTCIPMEVMIATRMVLVGILFQLAKADGPFGCMVGINAYDPSQWRAFAESIMAPFEVDGEIQEAYVADADAVGMDIHWASVHFFILAEVLQEAARQLGYSERDTVCVMMCWWTLAASPVVLMSELLQLFSQLLSGIFGTTEFNSILIAIVTYLAIIVITGLSPEAVLARARPKTYGDDNVPSIASSIVAACADLRPGYAAVGFEVTAASNKAEPPRFAKSLDGITFLKRSFRDITLDGRTLCVAPLEKSSLKRTLLWRNIESPDARGAMTATLQGLRVEAFFHGPVFYDEVCELVRGCAADAELVLEPCVQYAELFATIAAGALRAPWVV